MDLQGLGHKTLGTLFTLADTTLPFYCPPYSRRLKHLEKLPPAGISMSSDLGQSGNPDTASIITTHQLAVCSGIDAVGKSSLSVNLAIALARSGKRVCLLDTDSGIGNAHHQLGFSPGYSLASVDRKDCSLRDAIATGPGGITLLCDGGYWIQGKSRYGAQDPTLQRQWLKWTQQQDMVLIDTTTNDPAPWFSIVDGLLIVLAPESRCLSESFSLLCHLEPSVRKKPVYAIVNRSRGTHQAERVFEKFRSAVGKYLDIDLRFCGHIPQDDNIRNSAALQYPVALFDQQDPACAAFFKVAAALQAQCGQSRGSRGANANPTEKNIPQPARGTGSSDCEGATAREQFLRTPSLADELIDQGLLTAGELQKVIDDLLATGRREFATTFPGGHAQPRTQSPGEGGDQPSLLEKLRQSREAGLSMDQVLYQHLRDR